MQQLAVYAELFTFKFKNCFCRAEVAVQLVSVSRQKVEAYLVLHSEKFFGNLIKENYILVYKFTNKP
jgi:hypothetical protein